MVKRSWIKHDFKTGGRKPQVRVFHIDVGTISDEQVRQFMDEWRRQITTYGNPCGEEIILQDYP